MKDGIDSSGHAGTAKSLPPPMAILPMASGAPLRSDRREVGFGLDVTGRRTGAGRQLANRAAISSAIAGPASTDSIDSLPATLS